MIRDRATNCAANAFEMEQKSDIRGEVYLVSDAMLAILDELEGVHKGRYKRSEVNVVLLKPDGRNIMKKCFVYHLKHVPNNVLSQLSRISNYDLDEHNKAYRPKGQRDESRYQTER